MHEKPRHSWFAFRLRTLFVLIAIVAPALAWVGYSLKWIKQRHAALESGTNLLYCVGVFAEQPTRSELATVDAPWCLRTLRERGVSVVYWVPGRPSVDECKRLFPEAEVVCAIKADDTPYPLPNYVDYFSLYEQQTKGSPPRQP
jgi:hypothetical protein